jgi:hypothetical protein
MNLNGVVLKWRDAFFLPLDHDKTFSLHFHWLADSKSVHSESLTPGELA